MSDRDPFSQDPDPTEVFPPFRSEPTPPRGSDLPPIGADRDPDPTRVMPPSGPAGEPTTAMPPTGGPYDPGPPYGGGPGGPGGPGGGGPDDPAFEPEPEPWYRQPGPVAALIAGVAALVLALIALLVWTSDDDDTTDDTLPPPASTSTTTTVAQSTTEPATTTTEPATTTSSSTTTSTTSSTTSTTTSTTTTTTTTTTAPPTTPPPTEPPATTTTVPVITVPPGSAVWEIIQASDDLSELERVLECNDLVPAVDTEGPLTVLAPSNAAFDELRLQIPDLCAAPEQVGPILELHVVDTDLTAEQIQAEDQVTTRGGEVDVNDDGTIGSTSAAIVVPDVRASNGFVHAIDAVIQP